ncbi:MAG TPA: hypothetical protein VFN42_05980 [Acetobacteraceae bacterium]|nr:hypothetical protein [Acetobacteraceae bacterium]
MSKWLAAVSLLLGAAMLQGCVYDPNAGTYAPAAGYGYGGYPGYGGYGYPAYGYPASSYPAYGPSYGGSVTFGGMWGGGERRDDWDHRDQGARREEHRPDRAGRPVNLGAGFHPTPPQGGYHPPAASAGRGDNDRDKDRGEHH